MGLEDRLKRLEREVFGGDGPAHGWGVPTEIIAKEWERAFGTLPALVARHARRIRERRERGEPLDALLGSGGGVGADLMALAVSFGSREAVPDTVWAALERDAQRARECADLMRSFHQAVITDAFALLESQGGE